MAANSDVVEPQPRVVDLGASFAPAARARVDEYLRSFVSFEPVLGLLYSDIDEPPSWSLVALAKTHRRRAHQNVRQFRRGGLL